MLLATPIDPLTQRSSIGSNDLSERSDGSRGVHEPDLAASARILAMSPALRPQQPGPKRAANQPAHCGICKRELEGVGWHRHEGREERGSYCSPRCLAGAEALVALQLWSVGLESSGRRAEAEARTGLADDLLLLWRKRTGPEPKSVSAAVELARAREALK
jgi:hypothetical protein